MMTQGLDGTPLRHDADGPARLEPGTQDVLDRLTVARQQTLTYKAHSTGGPKLALRILLQTSSSTCK